MVEDHGEKAEPGKTVHFRAGVFNFGPGLGRTIGNADERGLRTLQGWIFQARSAL